MAYTPRRPKKLFWYMRALKGNREAIEAKKKRKDFEHPRKEEEQEEKKGKIGKTMKENARKCNKKMKMNENERT